MIIKHRTKGFVFKKIDRAEADRNFSIFTEDYGRLEVLGRAIRKSNSKLRSGIDLFYLSEIEFIQGKNSKTLTDASYIKKFENRGDEGYKFKIFCKISDILDKFIKGQEKDKKLFDLLDEVFEKLNSGMEFKNKQKIIYYFFIWNFLSILGYHPETKKCVLCLELLNPEIIYFSNKDGGVVCKKCLSVSNNAEKINDNFVKILRLLLQKDWSTLSRITTDEQTKKIMEDISKSYFSYIMPNM